jgi:hypothetical protein
MGERAQSPTDVARARRLKRADARSPDWNWGIAQARREVVDKEAFHQQLKQHHALLLPHDSGLGRTVVLAGNSGIEPGAPTESLDPPQGQTGGIPSRHQGVLLSAGRVEGYERGPSGQTTTRGRADGGRATGFTRLGGRPGVASPVSAFGRLPLARVLSVGCYRILRHGLSTGDSVIVVIEANEIVVLLGCPEGSPNGRPSSDPRTRRSNTPRRAFARPCFSSRWMLMLRAACVNIPP